MKKHITKLLLTFAAVICFSLTVSAQKTEEKKGERKPPKIIVPEKKESPKNDKSKNDKNGKRSGTISKMISGRIVVNI